MNNPQVNTLRRLAGWLIHIFTASGAFIGLLALLAIFEHQYLKSFWLMMIATLIDSVDGFFARWVRIKEAVPEVNGELLDNIVDFFNYTMVPAFFLLIADIIPSEWKFLLVFVVTLSSAYQFSQKEAKTHDHFFKGFPSYWNIAVFYLFFWELSPIMNMSILLALSLLSFIPIKFVYPSRLDYLTSNSSLRLSMLLATILWSITVVGLLWIYPNTNHTLVLISMSYLALYIGISVYRTWVPLVYSERLVEA